MKYNTALVVITLALAGCEAKVSQQDLQQLNAPAPVAVPAVSNRFIVSRRQVFSDGLAYGEVRGVYTLTDTETGKEYVGLSGVGLAETGEHHAGKTVVRDER